MNEHLFTSSETARMTNRARVTIQALARRTPGLGRKVGRDWVFTMDDVHRIQQIGKEGGRPAQRRMAAARNAHTTP